MSAAPYQSCRLCPRSCGVNRIGAKAGFCAESDCLRIASAVIHKGEEPPLCGTGGSGAVFVSGCNLGCVFCQNWQISANHTGIEVDTDLFVEICRALKEKGAENINIVTGSHVVPALIEGIAAARRKPSLLSLPVLWNSSGYEIPQTLEALADTVDVFMPDMKTMDSNLASRYFNAPDYPVIAAAAVKKMVELKPLRFEERDDGFTRMTGGVMVRHLVLPGHLEATRAVLRWFAGNCMGKALLSLMFQYTPLSFGKMPVQGGIGADALAYPQGYVTTEEYHTVLEWLGEFDIDDGYCQELIPGADWLPDFEQSNPFPVGLAEPVWHWKTGFCL